MTRGVLTILVHAAADDEPCLRAHHTRASHDCGTASTREQRLQNVDTSLLLLDGWQVHTTSLYVVVLLLCDNFDLFCLIYCYWGQHCHVY